MCRPMLSVGADSTLGLWCGAMDLTGRLHEALDEMVNATDRLLATVDGMREEQLHEPSRLPGWTRGHILTHIARNADGLANLAHWARTGDETPMYAGDSRDRDIEAGAGRHLGDQRLDLADSGERLLQAFADFPPEALGREVIMRSGATAAGWELPLLRVREVEIHHVDLGLGYTPADWSPAFVTRTLDQLATFFLSARNSPVRELVATDGQGRWEVGTTGPALAGPAAGLLAWLTGRSRGEGLVLDGGGEVPAAPRWA